VNVRTSTSPARPHGSDFTPDRPQELHGGSVALTWIRTHDWDANTWRTRSACRDSDPDVFFPVGSTGMALEQIETARRICTACQVSDECLEFALATNQEAGVWGGTTEEERRKLRKAWLAKQRAAS
jgi:WhiB family redox-sensing transcriptional regulator